ncbi:MAG TPA: hypothetical protein VHE34_20990 [Puia sp.]|uniref:hypothetical protein n=1 Tax=Puia sp. TaxID=2045100 RepID=UPI002B63EA3C|nr:hypothetical protein [Puia sp.]HVU97719.1 hypothetical protein [Puia sp.]
MKRQSPPVIQQRLFDVEPEEPKSVAGAQKNNGDDFVFEIMDALQSPILTFSHNWADMIPGRIIEIIPIARLAALLKKERTATYVETTAYLFTRTLEAPMPSDWVDIYTHVSCRTLQIWFGEDRWEDVSAPKELNDWLLSQLSGLRDKIYERRRKILKDRLKGSNSMKEAESVQRSRPPAQNQQSSLSF